jgi:hypothetical protein
MAREVVVFHEHLSLQTVAKSQLSLASITLLVPSQLHYGHSPKLEALILGGYPGLSALIFQSWGKFSTNF